MKSVTFYLFLDEELNLSSPPKHIFIRSNDRKF